jgi:hypothetical protein
MMTKENLRTKTTDQLKRWTNFHRGNKLNMLLDELCNRGEEPEDC